jgi:hypothetical protein
MIEPRTRSPGTLIADEHSQMNDQRNQLRRRCMMNKNSALLSIGAALLLSLFFVDVGHAFQTDRKHDVSIVTAGDMNGTTNLSAKQVSNTPNSCTEGGKGLTGAPGNKQCPPGSRAMATDGSRYTGQASNTPSPCGGRTGAPCTKQSPQGSGATAANGSRYISESLLVSLPVAGVLFGAGFIALFGLGARRLRQYHGHHDGHHA